MKTRTKALTLFSALLASAAIAGAVQEQQRQEDPNRKPAEFKCPTCGSPCINKAEMKRLLRWQRHHKQAWQRIRANRRACARQRFEGREQGPPHRVYRNGPMNSDHPRLGRQALRNRQPARAERPRLQNRREQGPSESNAVPERRQLQHTQRKAMLFDINGDGKLSKAEKAARRAYRQTMRAEQGGQPAQKPSPESQ